MKIDDWNYTQFVKEYLPSDKQAFSRDAVEILLSLLWKEAQRSARSTDKANQEYEKYGDL